MSKAKIRRARLGKGGLPRFSQFFLLNDFSPLSRSLEQATICLKVGLINAWESFILGVDCVFIKGLSLTNSWLSAYQSLM